MSTPHHRILMPLRKLLLLLPLLLAACAKPAEPTRIAIIPWPGYEFLYLASEFGYYAEAGVEARVVEFISLADAWLAELRGMVKGGGLWRGSQTASLLREAS